MKVFVSPNKSDTKGQELSVFLGRYMSVIEVEIIILIVVSLELSEVCVT